MIGLDVASMRKQLLMTREQFATLMGTNRNTVRRWESGESPPSGLYAVMLEAIHFSQMSARGRSGLRSLLEKSGGSLGAVLWWAVCQENKERGT